MKGTPYYYGDEIGMTNASLTTSKTIVILKRWQNMKDFKIQAAI
jgi:hypothetical protein